MKKSEIYTSNNRVKSFCTTLDYNRVYGNLHGVLSAFMSEMLGQPLGQDCICNPDYVTPCDVDICYTTSHDIVWNRLYRMHRMHNISCSGDTRLFQHVPSST